MTTLGAVGARLEIIEAEFDPARLAREARLRLDTRNATGAPGALPHVIRL